MNSFQRAMADDDRSAVVTFTIAIIAFVVIFGGCSWFSYYLIGAGVGLLIAVLTVVVGWHYHMYYRNIREWEKRHR